MVTDLSDDETVLRIDPAGATRLTLRRTRADQRTVVLAVRAADAGGDPLPRSVIAE
jgi:hypothetical protein